MSILKKYSFLLIIVLMVLLAACSKGQEEPPNFSGEVSSGKALGYEYTVTKEQDAITWTISHKGTTSTIYENPENKESLEEFMVAVNESKVLLVKLLLALSYIFIVALLAVYLYKKNSKLLKNSGILMLVATLIAVAITINTGAELKRELGDARYYSSIVINLQEMNELPPNIPAFVQTNDFDKINWNRKAENLGNNIIGNFKKSGAIGADMPSINGQKWMWHLWGTAGSKLTVVGYHRESRTVHQIVQSGWTLDLGGENNGADAHIPSSVSIPYPGEWAILLYVNEKLFDVLVYRINE